MDSELARLLLRVLGILVSHWDAQKLPRGHPYRQVAGMVRGFLSRKD